MTAGRVLTAVPGVAMLLRVHPTAFASTLADEDAEGAVGSPHLAAPIASTVILPAAWAWRRRTSG